MVGQLTGLECCHGWIQAFQEGHVGWWKGGVAVYEKKQQECMEFCLGTDKEPAESLYVSIRGQNKMGNVEVSVCYRLPDQEKVDEASSDNWKKPRTHRPWCSWHTLLLQNSKEPYPNIW